MNRRKRPRYPALRFFPILVFLLVVLVADDAPKSAEASAALDWQACGSSFQCAKLGVPLDYAAPAGRQIELSIIRRPAREPSKRIGSLVVNPGGPGASGIEFLRGWIGRLDGSIRDRFDIVSFDPRGVGESAPLRCHDNVERFVGADATPDTPQERQALIDASREFANLCATRGTDILPHLGTENVARDLDVIRAALGDEKLTYVGFSYGTSIGAVYADLFPNRIRAFVLDGAVDLSLGVEELASQQSRGFEGALQHFLTDCAVRRCLANPATDVDELLRRAEAAAIPSSLGARMAGQPEVVTALFTALYTDNTWPELGRAIADGLKGDSTGILRFVDSYLDRRPDGSFGNLVEAYTAVSCVDYSFPTSVERFETMAANAARQAPHFGATNVLSWLPCAFWSVPGTPRTAAPRGAGAPPIVVIGTTGDPATPYAWSVSVAKQLESAVLLSYFGEGHTIYSGNNCIDEVVDEYLVTLKTPAPGTACGDPAKSQPFVVSDEEPQTPQTDVLLPEEEDRARLRPAVVLAFGGMLLAAGVFAAFRAFRRAR